MFLNLQHSQVSGKDRKMAEERSAILKRLYCRFKHELNLYARQYCPDDAEDIVHQAFVNCYDHLEPTEAEISQRSYLYSTVKNLCLNFLRNQHPVYTEAPAELFTSFTIVDTHDYIYEYINKLPERESQILTLALQGYSTEDIAEKLRMNYNTVRHYKKEAYAKIRKALNNNI